MKKENEEVNCKIEKEGGEEVNITELRRKGERGLRSGRKARRR